MTRPIIIDTDPGIDDAVALAIALYNPLLDVRLITTVAGNASIERVTDNALKLLRFYNKQVPVARGAEKPLIQDFQDATDIHGDSGLGGYNFPDTNKPAALVEKPAVAAMYDSISASSELITIVAIGPLTNLALLFATYPTVKNKIKEIVFMGGGLQTGNKGVLSEFNIATDPEAAHIVVHSGIPLTMVPLDIGLKALVLPAHSEAIRKMNYVGDMIYSLFHDYRGGSFFTGLSMYDSYAMAYLLKPDLFQTITGYVDIELSGKYARGCTVVDSKDYLGNLPNCTVCVDISGDGFVNWFLGEISSFN